MDEMSLLDFARGPALVWSSIIMIAGITMRVIALMLRRRKKTLAPRREGAPSGTSGALSMLIGRMWPAEPFRDKANVPTAIAWTFHLGLLIILLGGTPHILLFADVLGFGWPGLPKGAIDIVSVITLAALIAALLRRITHPVRRLLSDTNDYVTWTITMLPVLTGLLATTPLGGRYETLLALHILSVELLMIWFPFGKLMHAIFWIPSRSATGRRFAHRGART